MIQGENFHDWLKNCENRESFPPRKFCRIRYTVKQFQEELATELIGKFHGRQRGGRKVQDVPTRLIERHFPDILGDQAHCKVCSEHYIRKRYKYGCKDCGNIHLCVTPCFRIYHTRSTL